ncbi:MAG: hypothetical protein HND52_16645 [Ignavibacteriae bacterium]|nr:hypothetical protein [Ignavibacteriota bacterium]NOG99588.1 hypothetical protein [Ignavibacteriota bacterium]
MKESLNDILTRTLKKQVLVDYLTTYPNEFENAVTIAMGNDKPQSWRAAWLLFHCMKDNDSRIKKHLTKILKLLISFEDGHQREWLKIIERMKLTEDQTSRLFDACLTIWEEITKSPSVRSTAFRVLLNIAKKYPELKEEIDHLTQNHYTENLSPGIKNSLIKILNSK